MSNIIRVDLSRVKTGDKQEYAQRLVVSTFMNPKGLPLYRLMTNYATGVGKAKAAIDTAAAFWDEGHRNPLFIAVPSEDARDKTWPEQIARWGRLHPALVAPDIECHAMMSRIKGNHYGLVILDEAHHITPVSYEFFEDNTYEGLLLLTATEPVDPLKKDLLRNLTGGRKLIITADQAIDAGILNDFEVYIMEVELDDTEHFKMFKNSNTLYTEQTGYLKHCSLIEQAKRSGNSLRIKFANIDRQRYIGDTETKTLATHYIQGQLRAKGHRFITFANSIAQADRLSTYTYHSETDNKWLQEFYQGRIDELVSIKQLKEAANFNNLGRGVKVQVNSNPGNFLQETGRLLRLPVGEVSRIYVLCATGTMDEVWVRKATARTNPDKIKRFKLDKQLYWIKYK